MKYCPICKTCYDDSDDRCQKDRIFLVEAFPGPRIVDTKYRIDALIGQGGMGAVYRATHTELDRVVALKVVLPDFVSSNETLERFRREARATARLNHPNVITIYDFGVLTNGRAYLAMELLTGRSLRDEIEKMGMLSAKRTLEIMRPVCEAVQAAHNAGVIHRDLKPDNIVLETNEFGQELVKVVDFGIAKLKEAPGIQNMSLTGPGLVMGTPHYMSPEQCKGEELDVRSDIYSLGVMLYEMISGHVPFDAPTPSAVIIQHAIDPPRRISQLRRDVVPELEIVIMKSLAKSRQARQQTVVELFAELERAIQPNAPPTVLASAKRSSDQQPVAPPAPVPVSKRATPPEISMARPETGSRSGAYSDYPEEPKEALVTKKRDSAFLTPPPAPVDPMLTAPLKDSDLAASIISTAVSDLDSEAYSLREDFAQTEDVMIGTEQVRLVEAASLQGHEHVIKAVCYSPEGKYLISASSDGSIKIWDLKKKRTRGALRGHELSVNALAISSNGAVLASAGSDGSVRIWDLGKEKEVLKFDNYQGSLRAVCFSPNNRQLALSNDATIEVWDMEKKKRVAKLEGHVRLVEAVEFSRDGSMIISGGVDETVRFWDANKHVSLGMISCNDHCINAISNSVDGILATAGKDHTIRLWDVSSRSDLAVLEGHEDSVRAVAFSSRGDYLVSGDWSGMVKLWDTATGAAMVTIEAHDGAVLTVAFSPDEKQVATAGYDQIIKLWNIEGLYDI